MRIRSHHDLAGTLVTPYSWEDHGGVLRLLPVYPSQCSLLQVTSTDVAFPPFCRSCPCDRHDLYLPSIPASLQTLGRCECVATCALAPLGLRIISPLTFYLSFLGAIWMAKIWLRSFPPIYPPSHPRSFQTLGPLLRIHICRYRYTYI